jgi:hypothetical protein
MLARINAAIDSPPGSPESLEGLRREISRELNTTKLRHELIELFRREGVRIRFLDSHSTWRNLLLGARGIVEEVRGKPIQFPSTPLGAWKKGPRQAYEYSRSRIEKKTGNTGATVIQFLVDYAKVAEKGDVLHWFCLLEGGSTMTSAMHPEALEPREAFKFA